MKILIEYTVWASVYLAMVALVYYALVSRVASPTQSRFFILTGMISSQLMAALVFFPGGAIQASLSAPAVVLPEFVVGQSAGISHLAQEVTHSLHPARLIIYASLIVSIFLSIRLFTGIILIMRCIRNQSSLRREGYTLVRMSKPITPFSFFHYVFIPEGMFSDGELDMVILHERAHISKRHSFDLIIAECIRILFWFHPAAWYLQRQLRIQHELEADRMVLKASIDKKAYQHLLLDMNKQGFRFSIINPLNYSPLKHRIMMMNKSVKQNSAGTVASIFLLVSLFAIVAVIQSCSHEAEHNTPAEALAEEKEQTAEKTQEDYEEDVIFTIVEWPPRFPGGEPARIQFMQEHLRYPEEAKNAGIEGTVFVSFVVEKDGSISDISVLRGIGGGCDEEAVRVVSKMPNWEPAMQRGDQVRVRFNMPIRFVLNQS